MYWEGDENYIIVLNFQYDYTSITLGYNEYPDSNVIERDFEFYRYDITTNELSEKDISDAVEKSVLKFMIYYWNLIKMFMKI
ncbi:hypothetical protein SD457_19320 [Coprobacillaceae bacterium CR2/5/TPMF4]|nr:hypothetical protein SD457_19320 [Coprobacillaceae bacterium CR2/5/TPMF4]